MIEVSEGGLVSAQLWYTIIQYFVGIIIVLALLFALTESSRKYDRFREWPYLAVASGYFLLLVWALLRALSLDVGFFHVITIGCQLIGFSTLGIGYLSLEHNKGVAYETPEESQHEMPHEEEKPVKDWVSYVSANHEPDEEPPPKEESTQPLTEEKPDSKEPAAPEAKPLTSPAKKQAKLQKTETPPAAVDLSYLAQRKKKPETVAAPVEAEEPVKEPPDNAASAPNATDTVETQDQEKVEPAPAKPRLRKKKKTSQSSKGEERAELLDDLFPIKKHPKSEPLGSADRPDDTSALLPGEAAKGLKRVPAGLLISGLTKANVLTIWPEAVVTLIIIFIIAELVPQREAKGNKLLIAGFVVLLLAMVNHLLFDSNIHSLPNLNESTGLFQLSALLLETIGFCLVGAASWARIKGKVTHHFLTIVSIIYLLLLVLTVGLANLIVSDLTSLRLLVLLITGVLATLLPILHSIAYNHPHQGTDIAHHDT